MPTYIQSRLHDAITVFGRFLRQAGCQIGTGEIMSAIEASSKINLSNREDFRHALKTCFITNHKMIPLFDQLFNRIEYFGFQFNGVRTDGEWSWLIYLWDAISKFFLPLFSK